MKINVSNNPVINSKPSLIGKILNKIKLVFSPSETEAEKPIHEEPVISKLEQEIKKDQDALEKLVEEFKTQTSLNVDGDKLSNAINNFQKYESIIFQSNGYYDGIKGTRDIKIKSNAKARANFIMQHTLSILKGRTNGLSEEELFKKSKINNLEKELSDEKEFNELINETNKAEHRHFSYPVGVSYIIFGVLLMFADFPISLSIAKYFIDLPIEFEDSFFNKISHPEIVLFALGITFLSIYFKIIYDDYINASIFNKKKMTGNSYNYDKGLAHKISSGLRFIFKILILCMLIYLLYNIGSVRNALNELSIEPLYPYITTTEQVFNYKLISFIGATILLPLLSGICLSIGLGIISNINNLRESNKKVIDLNEKINQLETESNNINMIKSTLKTIYDDFDEKDKNKLTDLTELFENSYVQGYKKGHRTQFGYEIYENIHSQYIDAINS